MSAGVEAPLVRHFDLLATAPGGVARLRELILTLAVQGKLVPQDPADEPASVLLQRIRAEKDRLIAKGKLKRDKDSASIDDGEVPFDLPSTWAWVCLAELLPDFQNGASSRGDVGGRLITVLRLADIKQRRVSLADTRQIPISENDVEKYALNEGDILVTRVNGSADIVGQFNLCDRPLEAIYCDHFIRLRINKQWFDPRFCALLSESPLVRRRIQGLFITTAGQKTVNQGHISSLPFPLPPLTEQSRIVTRVEELMRLCDALEQQRQLETAQHAQLLNTLLGTLTDCTSPDELAANWQRVSDHFDLLLDRPEAVDALEQTILQLAVRGLLVPQDPADEPASVLLQRIRAEKDRLIAAKKIKRDKPLPPINDEDISYDAPTGWEWVRVGELVNSSEAGWSPSCIGTPRRAGHWGVLKVSAVSWGKFDPEANKELPADLQPRPEYEVRPGDFLLSRANTAELVARSVVVDAVDARLMLSDKIIRLDVARLIDREYINFCNNSANARTYYAINASGTSSSMKNVSREVVLNLPIALPPLAEQTRIVARVTQLRDLCTTLRQRLAAAQTTQRHLAEALVEI